MRASPRHALSIRRYDCPALSRRITETPAGKAAYAEDRHAALTEACKVYRRGSQVAPSSDTGHRTDDDDDPGSVADPIAAEDQLALNLPARVGQLFGVSL